MEDFNDKNKDATFDFEKKVYLDEIDNLMNQIIDAFNKRDSEEFVDQMNKIAYLALIK